METFKLFLNLLNEIAFNKKIAEEKIRNSSRPLLLHLIKIIKYEDPKNLNKHINDIDKKWLNPIQDILINNKRVKQTVYYKLLYDEPIGDALSIIDSMVKRELKDYHNLPVIFSNYLVMVKIKNIINKVSIDLSNDNFETIKNYIK